MGMRRRLRLSTLLISIIFTGCASYAPSLVRLNPSGPNVKKETKGDLNIYLEEYATREKSERAFDTDLAPQGVLPLMILVENNGQQPYEVKSMDIVVRGATALKGLSPEETASRAERSAGARALGWSLIVPIISIPVAVAASAIHTTKVNEQIVRDFVAKSFPSGVIMPNKDLSEFLFFELEEGRKDLNDLILELTAKNFGTGESVKISAPLPNATFTQESRATAQEGSEESGRPHGD